MDLEEYTRRELELAAKDHQVAPPHPEDISAALGMDETTKLKRAQKGLKRAQRGLKKPKHKLV